MTPHDPINGDYTAETLPPQEHFDQAHKSFIDRVRATFQGAPAAPVNDWQTVEHPDVNDWKDVSADDLKKSDSLASGIAHQAGSFLTGLVPDTVKGIAESVKTALPSPDITAPQEAKELIDKGDYFGAAKLLATHAVEATPGGKFITGAIHNVIDEGKKAVESYKKGDVATAASHVGRAVPVVGPMIGGLADTAEQDPARALGQVAGLALAPKVVEGVAPAVAEGASTAIEKGGTWAARKAMRSALKPGVADAKTLADAREVTNTALENEIPVSEKGAAKLAGLIKDYGEKTQAVIDAKTRAGMTVKPEAVASRLDQIDTSRPLPEKDIATIAKAKADFLARNGVKPAQPPMPTGVLDASGQPVMRPGAPASAGKPIPFDVAQAEKQGAYQRIDYGKMSEAQIESEKMLARGYKENLEEQAPELKLLNDKEGKLLGLQPALERAVRRAANEDALSLKQVAAAGAGGPAMGLAARMLDYPWLKSNLAIALSRASWKARAPISLAAAHTRAATILGRIAAQQAAIGSGLPQAASDGQRPETIAAR